MTIIVFLVDTSASMQQKAFGSGRSTLLDVAKGAVEFFVKMRQKSPESRGDRYMLLTFEEYPRNIKAGWKENLQTFMNELKNLEASGMTTMGSALKQVFDTLNINRMQTGIDMYGQGRYPFYLEPAVIVVISDGGKLTTQGTVQFELNLPMHSSVPGSELTREPFRWDQRLYALVLRMAGTPPQPHEAHVAKDHSPIDAMCEVTGGRSYSVTSQRVLHQCIDSLVQKLQSGVVIHFEKIGPDPPPLPNGKDGVIDVDNEAAAVVAATAGSHMDVEDFKGLTFSKDKEATGGGSNSSRPHTPNPMLAASNREWHTCRKLIYVPRSAQKGFAVGFWPLPEAFWPDMAAPVLPQRSAHPNIKFTCANAEPMIIDNLPFDKYELEPSPLTLYILARKQPKFCWQVFIQGSSKNGSGDLGHPFGYLKASTNLLTVNLFVLPYNFPVLLPLLEELFKIHRLKPSSDWRAQFHAYLRTMPAYYAGPLRRGLTRMGAGNLANTLIPETMDNCLSYSVLNYLKRLKNQAKVEYEKTLGSSASKGLKGVIPEGIKVAPRSPFKKELLANQLLKDKFALLRDQLTDFPGFLLGIKDTKSKGGLISSTGNRFRNPFDVPRKSLLDQIVRMRANYLQPSVTNTKLVDEDSRHSLPISQMGNYQDYLKNAAVPLREIESTPVRQHMFGNPFKINKNMIMDEVVLDEVSLNGSPNGGISGNQMPSGGRTPKRQGDPIPSPAAKRAKKGPLPRDFVYRKTPPGTPVHNSCSAAQESHPSVISPPQSPVDVSANGGSDSAFELSSPSKSDFSYGSDSESSEPDLFRPLHIVDTPEVVPATPAAAPEPRPAAPTTRPELRLATPEPRVNGSTSTTTNGHGHLNGTAPPPPPPTAVSAAIKKHRSSRDRSPIPPSYSTVRATAVANHTHKTSPLVKTEIVSDSSGTAPLSKEELKSFQLRNQNMRQIIYKEVKRPGKNHERLMQMLRNDLHGPPAVRREYIRDVITEAGRFKRRSLAELLERRMEELVQLASTA